MPRIYTEKGPRTQAPPPPETSLLRYAAEKRGAAVKELGATTEYLAKKQEAVAKAEAKSEEQRIKNLFELSSIKMKGVLQEAHTLYPDDDQKYLEKVTPVIEKMAESLPEDFLKTKLMAEVSVMGSGYAAKARMNKINRVDNNRTKVINSIVNQDIEYLENNAHELISNDNQDILAIMFRKEQDVVRSLDATNRHGVPVISTVKRLGLREQRAGILYLGLEQWASLNYDDNPEAVKAKLEELTGNKEAALQTYGNYPDKLAETIAAMESVVNKQKSKEQVYAEAKTRFETAEKLAEAIDPDTLEINKDYDNPIALGALIKQVEATPFNTRAPQEKALRQKVILERALVAKIRKDPKIKTKWFTDRPRRASDAILKGVEGYYLIARGGMNREDYFNSPEVVSEYAQIVSMVSARASDAGVELDSKNSAEVKTLGEWTTAAIIETAKLNYPTEYAQIKKDYEGKNVTNLFLAQKARLIAKKNKVNAQIDSQLERPVEIDNDKVAEIEGWLRGD